MASGASGRRVSKQTIDAFFRDRNGPVVLHAANAGRSLLARSKALAPRGDGFSGSGREKPKPRLFESGTFEMVKTNGMWTAEVVFHADHAASVIKGSRPHPIPKAGAGNLVFWWPNAPEGPRLFGKPFPNRVNHPGHPDGYDFVKDAAQQIGLHITRPL